MYLHQRESHKFFITSNGNKKRNKNNIADNESVGDQSLCLISYNISWENIFFRFLQLFSFQRKTFSAELQKIIQKANLKNKKDLILLPDFYIFKCTNEL